MVPRRPPAPVRGQPEAFNFYDDGDGFGVRPLHAWKLPQLHAKLLLWQESLGFTVPIKLAG